MKYSDVVFQWLKRSGYSHCYFVAGGNIMHLLNSARQTMHCVPVVHEVAAVVAAEYHNATVSSGKVTKPMGRAIALVTAGPGLTNALTGLAGAWLESRELLLLGGQAKVADLASSGLRQLGIQEVNGVAMAAPVCKRSLCLREPLEQQAFLAEVSSCWQARPGPVFLEFPLDVQAMQVPDAWVAGIDEANINKADGAGPVIDSDMVHSLAVSIAAAERPVLLLGGGISCVTAQQLEPQLASLGLPVMTTWNGADRYGAEHSNYFGRPNTWGQRYSNLLIQQSDFLVAIGSRLGLQQTGFNWQEFVPAGKVIQVDIDPAELAKPNPKLDLAIEANANDFIQQLLSFDLGIHPDWLAYCSEVKTRLPISEACNFTPVGYLNPFEMVIMLSKLCNASDHIVPCSSGGAFTVMMQAFELQQGQTMITDKGLASMGYGLSGAIGTSIADPDVRTVLVEGDGGFTQNLQELATVAVNNLNLKMFLFCNNGYASIRMTQKNYFGGAYMGCDISSGLGFPDWSKLAEAYGIDCFELGDDWWDAERFDHLWNHQGPALFLVPLHPEQTYSPKIVSRISANGGMESNPLHRMSPDLDQELEDFVTRFIPKKAS
ncbi:Acetolactate synthase isozyme 1 large subunit [Prochlorococcus sp. MIT 1306]|nr:thiamine pyrophosphate-binding protein [Prochlorococcus sp. MIT 1306]KZR61046.1 Acetolactate synthase isozyme 1 large subunit [Prochlorococcus sp. MIT 1306]